MTKKSAVNLRFNRSPKPSLTSPNKGSVDEVNETLQGTTSRGQGLPNREIPLVTATVSSRQQASGCRLTLWKAQLGAIGFSADQVT